MQTVPSYEGYASCYLAWRATYVHWSGFGFHQGSRGGGGGGGGVGILPFPPIIILTHKSGRGWL